MAPERYQQLEVTSGVTTYRFFHEEVAETVDPYPGDIIYAQIAMIGPRAGIVTMEGQEFRRNEFAPGREVVYQMIHIQELQQQRGMVDALAALIYLQLEKPIFGLQSDQMFYKVRDFIKLLSRPDTMVIMAWERDPETEAMTRPVGYLIAEQFLNRNDIPARDRQTDTGRIAAPPKKGALIFDTFAVSRQGEQIGKTLVDLMLANVPKGVDQLVTFAVDPDSIPDQAKTRAYPHTMRMLLNNPHLKLMDVNHIRGYRGLEAYFLRMHII